MIPPVKQNIYRLTEDQKAEIRRLWSENKDVEVIAALVGLTRDCMRRHRKALNLPPRNNRGIVFTPEQDAELIRLSATMGRARLAEHFGVKQDWTATKILRMGLRQHSKPVPPRPSPRRSPSYGPNACARAAPNRCRRGTRLPRRRSNPRRAGRPANDPRTTRRARVCRAPRAAWRASPPGAAVACQAGVRSRRTG